MYMYIVLHSEDNLYEQYYTLWLPHDTWLYMFFVCLKAVKITNFDCYVKVQTLFAYVWPIFYCTKANKYANDNIKLISTF